MIWKYGEYLTIIFYDMDLTKEEKKRLYDLVDFLLLNASGLSSSGLARGKSGVALALFEVADLLEDGYLEDQAFSLLQETLLSKIQDISFESGWGGIAFTLVYLVKNGLLEADVHDILTDKLRWIRSTTYELLVQDPFWEVKHLDMVLMWHLLGGSWFISYRDSALQSAEHVINMLFTSMENGLGCHVSSKRKILQKLQDYLRIVLLCDGYSPSESLMNRYIGLFKENKFRSEAGIGHFLVQLGIRFKKEHWEELGYRHLETAAYIELEECEPLHKKLTRYFHLLHYDRYALNIVRQVEQSFFRSLPDELEKKLEELGKWESEGVGLGFGVARLLVLLCAVCRWREGMLPSRFAFILG